MEDKEIKSIVAKLLEEGESLGNILKVLDSEYNAKMTFLELRLLASEIENIDWTKNEEEVEPKKDDEKVLEETEDTTGKTVVEINRLTRPGIAMHGTVKFASGASADWILDQTGRLGFEKSEGKPTPEDIQEFQEELQKSLGA
jgi:hypothetical protein